MFLEKKNQMENLRSFLNIWKNKKSFLNIVVLVSSKRTLGLYLPFLYMSHSQMLGKFEYGGGPIFKVVLEC